VLEIMTIFKSNLLKEVAAMGQQEFLTLGTDEEHTLLQLFIYVLLMCENKDIYCSIETARVFCDCENETPMVG
jgi:hypothetical protein